MSSTCLQLSSCLWSQKPRLSAQLLHFLHEKTGSLKRRDVSRFMCQRAELGWKPVSCSRALSAPRQASFWPLVGSASDYGPFPTPSPDCWLKSDADPADTWSFESLVVGAHPASCRPSGHIPGRSLPNASSTPSPAVTGASKDAPHGPGVPRGQGVGRAGGAPGLRIPVLE